MDVAVQECQTRRGVAQPGSVLAWGASGRPFKSARPDQSLHHAAMSCQ
jgi:hypothetical protein